MIDILLFISYFLHLLIENLKQKDHNFAIFIEVIRKIVVILIRLILFFQSLISLLG